MASSFFYSMNCSGKMLSKNWMWLAASRLQVVPEWPLVACKLYPTTWIKSTGICMRLVDTRVWFACDWPPLGYNLYVTGRQPVLTSDWRSPWYNLLLLWRALDSSPYCLNNFISYMYRVLPYYWPGRQTHIISRRQQSNPAAEKMEKQITW